jgi:hypothetical protein
VEREFIPQTLIEEASPFMSLRDVLIDELKDLYSAENQLVKALPKTAKGTSNPELKQAFLNHLEETRGHVVRLQQCFQTLGKKATAKHCKGMEGAIDEVKEALGEDEEGALLDAGIIGAALRDRRLHGLHRHEQDAGRDGGCRPIDPDPAGRAERQQAGHDAGEGNPERSRCPGVGVNFY